MCLFLAGDARIPGSLHYITEHGMNDYEEAISVVGGVISKYSASHNYPVWGFGAKYDGEVRHIFQCGAAQSVDEILSAYKGTFKSDLIMSGPTVFVKVIGAAASKAKAFLVSYYIVENLDFDMQDERLQLFVALPNVLFAHVCLFRI